MELQNFHVKHKIKVHSGNVLMVFDTEGNPLGGFMLESGMITVAVPEGEKEEIKLGSHVAPLEGGPYARN